MHANRPDGHPGDSGPGITARLRRALTTALKARDKDLAGQDGGVRA
jgi:hypothetical protein